MADRCRTPELKLKCRELRIQQRLSIPEIMEHTGAKYGAVRKWLLDVPLTKEDKKNLTIRIKKSQNEGTHSRFMPSFKIKDQSLFEECRRLREEERMFIPEISKKTGVKEGTLRRWLASFPLTAEELIQNSKKTNQKGMAALARIREETGKNAQREECIRLKLEEGKTFTEIRALVNVSKSTLSGWLKSCTKIDQLRDAETVATIEQSISNDSNKGKIPKNPISDKKWTQFKDAQIKARQWHINSRLARVDKYNANPKLCKKCSKPIDYDKQVNNFCSKSCSCTFNNFNRNSTYTNETRNKISQGVSKWIKDNPEKFWTEGRIIGLNKLMDLNNKSRKEMIEISCPICSTPFLTKNSNVIRRKTCSKECRTKAIFIGRTYQNGSRKTIPYWNLTEEREVILESSWEKEIAELLDSIFIAWTRPQPLPWTDKKGIEHLYYADFYLPDFDLYLDPKNTYCMKKDEEKMEAISQNVNLVYGAISVIKSKIESLIPRKNDS